MGVLKGAWGWALAAVLLIASGTLLIAQPNGGTGDGPDRPEGTASSAANAHPPATSAAGQGMATSSETGDSAALAPKPAADRFNERLAARLVRAQVALGPRPAGSRASRRLARKLRRLLPRGRLEPVPGHPRLRNVTGWVPGRDRSRTVIVGAHYDTKDLPGLVGANDGASGTAVVTALARSIGPRRAGPSLRFILFDGEESPAGSPDAQFARHGLRGSKAAARRHAGAEAMILLDLVGDRDLRIPRESFSHRGLWSHLRAAAHEVGTGAVFPRESRPGILDDHLPFRRHGVPAINLIDFDFPCWHRRCDDLSAVSARSLDAVGETVLRLLTAPGGPLGRTE